MPEFPVGTVTLVFTDIEGSSELAERYRDTYETVRQEHDSLMCAAIECWNGVEVKTIGDAFMIAFGAASNAVQFAVEAQRRLVDYDWPSVLPGLAALRVRIGIHSGEALLQ